MKLNPLIPRSADAFLPFFFLALFLVLSPALLSPLYSEAIVIPIKGPVEPPLFKFLEKSLTKATNQLLTRSAPSASQQTNEQSKAATAAKPFPPTIILEINTFGGRVDITYKILELLNPLSAQGIRLISVVEEKAISAGTLIALAAEALYMKENTTIGDVAPIMVTSEGPRMLGEKFQSPLRAKFRSLALKNGYPVKLAEAFVSADREIIELTFKDGTKEVVNDIEFNDLNERERQNIVKRRTLVAKGELLTMNNIEAEELGFSRATIKDLKAVVGEEVAVVRLEKTSSDSLMELLHSYSWLLLLIGFGGMYLEIKTPGFGFFGISALIAFGVFFFGQYLAELANYYELLLLILALSLIAVELFILPGLGVVGALGVALLLSALLLMMQDFAIPQTPFEFQTVLDNLKLVLLVFMGSTLLFVLSFFIFPRVFKGKLLTLQAANSAARLSPPLEPSSKPPLPVSSDKKAAAAQQAHRQTVTAQEGVALTDLRPTGKIEIGGQLYDAATGGEFIKSGTKVVVFDKMGFNLLVKEVEEG